VRRLLLGPRRRPRGRPSARPSVRRGAQDDAGFNVRPKGAGLVEPTVAAPEIGGTIRARKGKTECWEKRPLREKERGQIQTEDSRQSISEAHNETRCKTQVASCAKRRRRTPFGGVSLRIGRFFRSLRTLGFGPRRSRCAGRGAIRVRSSVIGSTPSRRLESAWAGFGRASFFARGRGVGARSFHEPTAGCSKRAGGLGVNCHGGSANFRSRPNRPQAAVISPASTAMIDSTNVGANERKWTLVGGEIFPLIFLGSHPWARLERRDHRLRRIASELATARGLWSRRRKPDACCSRSAQPPRLSAGWLGHLTIVKLGEAGGERAPRTAWTDAAAAYRSARRSASRPQSEWTWWESNPRRGAKNPLGANPARSSSNPRIDRGAGRDPVLFESSQQLT
jgi:hypothetical protein